MTNSVFSDQELEYCIARLGYRTVDSYGAESRAYHIAKQVRDRIEESLLSESLERVWAHSVPWQEETFPQATTKSIAAHLLREAQELMQNPDDSEELADILLLVGHLAHKLGINPAMETMYKLKKNMARKWGSPDTEGVVEHVRDDDPTLLVNIFKDDGAPNVIEEVTKGTTYVPPAQDTYEIGEDGVPTGRKLIFYNASGGPHSWRDMYPDKWHSGQDVKILAESAARVAHEEGNDPHTPTVRYMRSGNKVSP
jgi:predicted house-cleaning noncanonical NTP pyrophosphatase (MazG superfamily)